MQSICCQFRFRRLQIFVLVLAAVVLGAPKGNAQTVPGGQGSSAAVLAATPPMGWNSWNFFARKVTDQDVRGAADALVASGMKDAGYVYVNLDGSWQGVRDANGVLHTNAKFPDMKALVDYVHSKGLKFGIYSTPGRKTCGGDEGSYGHEAQDAKMFADWGVDYLKYDLCSFETDGMLAVAPGDQATQMRNLYAAYERMGRALKATGRPIVFSLCEYGFDAVWEWAPKIGGNLWRTTYDIEPTWERMYELLQLQDGLEDYAGPGHWNDPDMLEVGNGKLTPGENRVHFSMWAMLSAPLLAGNDLPHMSREVLKILTNGEVIALDQDPLGKQARHVYSEGEVAVWVKPLADGGHAIAIINAGQSRVATHPFHLNLAKLGMPQTPSKMTGKNLWTGQKVELYDGVPLEIPRHDILLVRFPALSAK